MRPPRRVCVCGAKNGDYEQDYDYEAGPGAFVRTLACISALTNPPRRARVRFGTMGAVRDGAAADRNWACISVSERATMKGFPNQVSTLETLASALNVLQDLEEKGSNPKDDGIFGEALIRSHVLGTGHKAIPVEEYLAQQKSKKDAADQSFRNKSPWTSRALSRSWPH